MAASIVVRVPCSTSNCGSGFDTLGLALNLYGRVRLSQRDDDRVVYAGTNPVFPTAAIGMLGEVRQSFAQALGTDVPGFDFNIESEVPVARGLGSSVILRAGALGCLNALAGSPLSRDRMVEIVTQIEGHPDNASAGILGGFTVARFCPQRQHYLGTQSFPVSRSLAFVVVAPELEIITDESRKRLPEEIGFQDVVDSLNGLAYLVAAFSSGRYENLGVYRVDRLHEPQRLKNIPQGREAIDAGTDAGALTGWLSGSGSSVLCVTHREKSASVLQAMSSRFQEHGIPVDSYTLQADNSGLTVEE